tara:strand:+ start:466 stop:1383 length:918 start_codon:yes stop_codon:yes gene_type:complete
MKEPKTIAILGLGEAGTALASGLRDGLVWSEGKGDLLAVDIAFDDGARGHAIRDRATTLNVPVYKDYGQFLAGADIVISVVTGVEALSAITEAKPHLKDGAVFLDLNTVTREMAITNASVVEDSGINYIDVAVMGMFYNFGYKAPLLLAGPNASMVGDWMSAAGFDITVLSEHIGDASAVKMLRSILMKGLEALSVECLVAAERHGLRSAVLNCLADLDNISFADFVCKLVTTHTVHAQRRLEEMTLVRETLIDSGVQPLMTDAICRSHARTIDSKAIVENGVVPELSEALSRLMGTVQASAAQT